MKVLKDDFDSFGKITEVHIGWVAKVIKIHAANQSSVETNLYLTWFTSGRNKQVIDLFTLKLMPTLRVQCGETTDQYN